MTDVPCSIFWRELLAAYPSAKVILTVRDSTAAWAKSYSATINYVTERDYTPPTPLPSLTRFLYSWLLPAETPFDRLMKVQVKHTPRGTFRRDGREWYERHNAEVQAAVSEEQLLVYNVKQGWGPLCGFLGVDVPAEGKPFPKMLDTHAFLKVVDRRAEVQRRTVVTRLVGIVGTAMVVVVAAAVIPYYFDELA